MAADNAYVRSVNILLDRPAAHNLNQIALIHLADTIADEPDEKRAGDLFVEFCTVLASPVPMARCDYDYCRAWFPTSELERVGSGMSFCRECAAEDRAEKAQARHDFSRRFFGRGL